MDLARDELLARAALAQDQHRRRRRRRARDLGPQPAHRLAVADELGLLARRGAAAARSRPAGGCPRARCATETSTRSRWSGFSRKSTAPRRVHSTAVAMSPWPEIIRTGGAPPARDDPVEGLEAVHAGHLDVEQHGVGRRRRRARRAPRGRPPTVADLVALVLEDHPQRVADRGFVVDDRGFVVPSSLSDNGIPLRNVPSNANARRGAGVCERDRNGAQSSIFTSAKRETLARGL